MRWTKDLIQMIRERIERDPETYANLDRLDLIEALNEIERSHRVEQAALRVIELGQLRERSRKRGGQIRLDIRAAHEKAIADLNSLKTIGPGEIPDFTNSKPREQETVSEPEPKQEPDPNQYRECAECGEHKLFREFWPITDPGTARKFRLSSLCKTCNAKHDPIPITPYLSPPYEAPRRMTLRERMLRVREDVDDPPGGGVS